MFLNKDNWPPNSPDLNPCDFYLWNAIVTRMKLEKFSSREQLIKEINSAILKLPLEEVKKAINSFTSRVRKVEGNNGTYCLK